MFGKRREIHGVRLDNPEMYTMPALIMPHVFNPLAIDYDAATNRLYWTDGDVQYRQKGIHSALLNVSSLLTIIDSSTLL